ncbi:SRPBCC domain-containing protein [Arthrobacter sp. zg-Y820]|uniref:SRPBCC domain-containing protein n=1 Tax=unclassified Arthrobacter TaxID=235627 RepID=UPI001E5E2974|nr:MULTISPECIES: SRPBCC domain-containing protein [unclassified Arthrobacter]MCC9197000.1 SRPBCC domain-containing protein [Arthrobacter sp. zg-Y820]MDK1279865.1 SRPBCC domain-containing protein [Arthrobacter sp. zg.Y820]MDK1360011.1 SRPBCC domain-containing protein [Arthrobacter sp. zg-Y1219]WIB09170.1 SRPBCC domain-containing protein [Arthrobacter sp. zg-Y820]
MSEADSAFVPTERTFGRRQIQAGHALMMVISRTIPHPIGEVWAAITDPEALGRYVGRPEGDLRRGGTYALPDGTRGGILRCDPPRLLTVSVTRPGGHSAELELHLTAEDSHTHIDLRYASVRKGFVLIDAVSGEWAAGPGWEFFLDSLSNFLSDNPPDEPLGIIGWRSFEGEQLDLYEARNAEWEKAKADWDHEHEAAPGPS